MNVSKSKIYRHKKSQVNYKVIAISTHTVTKEILVTYQNVDDPSKIWTQPLDRFSDGRFEEVQKRSKKTVLTELQERELKSFIEKGREMLRKEKW